ASCPPPDDPLPPPDLTLFFLSSVKTIVLSQSRSPLPPGCTRPPEHSSLIGLRYPSIPAGPRKTSSPSPPADSRSLVAGSKIAASVCAVTVPQVNRLSGS